MSTAIAAIEQRVRVWREEERQAIWACGWCKGFVHQEFRGGMYRMIHDEEPATKHEVLPYRVR